MNKIRVEKYAATFPCQFCGAPSNKVVEIYGCVERKYKNVVFGICNSCMKKIGTELVNNSER